MVRPNACEGSKRGCSYRRQGGGASKTAVLNHKTTCFRRTKRLLKRPEKETLGLVTSTNKGEKHFFLPCRPKAYLQCIRPVAGD